MTESLAKIAGFLKSRRDTRSSVSTALDVSSNGTTSVPPDSLAETIRLRFAELHASEKSANAQTNQGVRVGQK